MNFILFIIFQIICIISCKEFSSDDVLSESHKILKRGLEEIDMTAPQMIKMHNYTVEEYQVTTEDGYILTLHRILPKNRCRNRLKRETPKPPVLLFHGVLASTVNWIISGPQSSIAYMLADAGYDVWLGNARGNPYSRMHRTLIPANMKFWDFSFHEIAVYDLPASIDFILENTGFPHLFYAGHSQGSTVILILLAQKPEYNNKVISGYLLSPVGYMNHMTSPFLIFFSIFANQIGLFFDLIGYGEFLPNTKLMASIAQILCKGSDFTQFICSTPLFLITGLNPDNVYADRLPVYIGHAGGIASRQLIHFGQLFNSGQFRQFDFGIIENLPTYHSLKPPLYPLGKIRSPLYMFAAKNDWLASLVDVDRLIREVPNSIKIDIPDPTFTHLDFMLGKNAKDLVYTPLLLSIQNLTSGLYPPKVPPVEPKPPINTEIPPFKIPAPISPPISNIPPIYNPNIPNYLPFNIYPNISNNYP